MTWYWVSLSYATYGVAIEDGVVLDAAPIARWMVGKNRTFCFEWLRNKGATIRRLP